jgi:hypothetical protein
MRDNLKNYIDFDYKGPNNEKKESDQAVYSIES